MIFMINDNEKTFWDKHKDKIILGGLLAGAVVITYIKSKSSNCVTTNTRLIDTPNTIFRVQEIDEDIYTNVAQFIEDAVFDETFDTLGYDITYNVPIPINGNYANGSHDVLKNVQVIVKGIKKTGEEVV